MISALDATAGYIVSIAQYNSSFLILQVIEVTEKSLLKWWEVPSL